MRRGIQLIVKIVKEGGERREKGRRKGKGRKRS